MSGFELYFSLGREHILKWGALDHLLFVIALCTVYTARDWKNVLILVTAFTIGHSITLALASMDLIGFDEGLIEVLIPITIFITAVGNIWKSGADLRRKTITINYYFALFFGLIHGLAYANDLKQMLSKGASLVTQLFAFNLGLELGQIIVVVVFMGIGFVLNFLFPIKKRDWIIVISSAIAGVALSLMIK